jgi:hypothetical protein
MAEPVDKEKLDKLFNCDVWERRVSILKEVVPVADVMW